MRAIFMGFISMLFVHLASAESLPPLTFGHDADASQMFDSYRSAKYEPAKYSVRYSPSGKYFNMDVLKASYSSPTFKPAMRGFFIAWRKPMARTTAAQVEGPNVLAFLDINLANK